MPVTNCPHCGHQVGFGADALCPRCLLPRAPVTNEELARAVERLAEAERRPGSLSDDELGEQQSRSLSFLGMGIVVFILWAIATFVPWKVAPHPVYLHLLLEVGFMAVSGGVMGLLFGKRTPF